MKTLGEDLEAMVEQDQGANLATSEPANTTSVESLLGGSTAPSSSHSIPSAILVPLARAQKLEARIATLLHHIQPWM